MIKTNKSIVSAKEKIRKYFEKDVIVKVNLGRNKYASFTGKVTNIYPALFTVTPHKSFNGKTSFSYSELMCGLVLIKKIDKAE